MSINHSNFSRIKRCFFVSLFTMLLVNGHNLFSQAHATRQADSHIATANQMNEIFNMAGAKTTTVDYSTIEGSPYEDDQYQKGILKNKQGEELGEYAMKYNAFADMMEVLRSNKSIGALNKVGFLTIDLNQKKYTALDYRNEDGKIEKGYFIEIVQDSTCSLYRREVKTLQEEQAAKSTFHPPTPAKFLEDTHHYLKFGRNEPKKIKLSKKKIFKSFPKMEDELKGFAKKEKLNTATEDGIIELVKYYNSIAKNSSK